MHKTCIVLSTYNNEDIIEKCIKSCISQALCEIVVADDGSTDGTLGVLRRLEECNSNLHIISLEHGERGIARAEAIKLAKSLSPEYLYVIDSDMILDSQLVLRCVDYLGKHSDVGGLVIPENCYSNYGNFYSKVKVFERNVLIEQGKILD